MEHVDWLTGRVVGPALAFLYAQLVGEMWDQFFVVLDAGQQPAGIKYKAKESLSLSSLFMSPFFEPPFTPPHQNKSYKVRISFIQFIMLCTCFVFLVRVFALRAVDVN